MKKLTCMIVLATSVSLAAAAALQPASAQSHRYYPTRGFQSHNAALAGGYRGVPNSRYSAGYDRASSPYAGGP